MSHSSDSNTFSLTLEHGVLMLRHPSGSLVSPKGCHTHEADEYVSSLLPTKSYVIHVRLTSEARPLLLLHLLRRYRSGVPSWFDLFQVQPLSAAEKSKRALRSAPHLAELVDLFVQDCLRTTFLGMGAGYPCTLRF